MTAPMFTKFDPAAFLENEIRGATAAKSAKVAKAPAPERDAALATLATLARGTSFVRVARSDGGEPGLEQPCAVRRGRVQEMDRIFLHFCEVCGRFGAFGYGVHLKAGQIGRWYCGEHRPRSTHQG